MVQEAVGQQGSLKDRWVAKRVVSSSSQEKYVFADEQSAEDQGQGRAESWKIADSCRSLQTRRRGKQRYDIGI